jgi:hypothetical protein
VALEETGPRDQVASEETEEKVGSCPTSTRQSAKACERPRLI